MVNNKEFEERVIQVNRLSKKTKGGNAMSFSALVAIGDRNGKVGFGYGKSKDVSSAISKATQVAKRTLIPVRKNGDTIPHEVKTKFSSTTILLRPAPKGTGIIAGGAVRQVLEISGIKDISAKILGSSNKLSTVSATMKALGSFKG